MFQNKNWFKVLVSQVIAAVVTLAAFFGYRWLGIEDKDAAAFAFATLAAAALAAFAFASFALILAFALASVTAFTAALISVDAPFAAFTAFTLAFAFVSIIAADEYKLSWYRVALTYLAEVAAIFFPIYFTLN